MELDVQILKAKNRSGKDLISNNEQVLITFKKCNLKDIYPNHDFIDKQLIKQFLMNKT